MAHFQRQGRLLPVAWPLYLAAAILPFVLGVLIMQFLAGSLPGGIEALIPVALGDDDGAVDELAHLGDLLTYGAAFFIQVATCAVVLQLHWSSIRTQTPETGTACIRLLLLILAVGAGVATVVRVTDAAAYALTYDLTRGLLLSVDGLPESFAAGNYFLGQSRMFFSAAMPFLIGVLVVAFGAAAGAAESTPTDTAAPEWERCFGERFERLQNAFRGSSLVLVTSAVSLMLFLQLPAPSMSESYGEAVSRFALALTVYWGVVMTLTLLALFLPPYLAMRREAIRRHEIAGTNQDLEKWLDERQHRPMRRHLANLATLLAPILVGPVGSLAQSIMGG
ncbi:hypothetical protein Thimo_0546 [Thioflavicoccus mobilis 8321]|uniref:Uncharacterized protein n=1 Tax=Thioflavicoccus mobilis 8321 TaxID=765912 RepID=L0GRK8_9GAMM|nr:hypothetical protein [Thioflavicoccus mobilis]AGA89398.1 hypothetical protein Thimo_0546 [Thioflavicoccus mobilis 8321]